MTQEEKDQVIKAQAKNLWFEQSKLLWSRLQTASFVEAAALTAAYKLWSDQHPIMTVGILLLATVILILVGLLMCRDAQHLKALEKTADDLFPKPAKPLFGLYGTSIGKFGICVLIAFNLLAVGYFLAQCHLVEHCHCHRFHHRIHYFQGSNQDTTLR